MTTASGWRVRAVRPADERFKAELGVRIARLRMDRNLTQRALANAARVSVRALGRYENGQTHMPAYAARRLSEALGVSLNSLLPSILSAPGGED